MKYNIYINQKSLFELANKKKIKIDLIDWAIINWIKDFHNAPKIKKIEIDWKRFFWIAYKHLLNDMPLLWLKTKWAIWTRLKKLVDIWLLEKYFDLEWWSMTYFYCTDSFYELERVKSENERVQFENEGVQFENDRGMVLEKEGYGSKTIGGTVWKPYNHNTINTNTINNTKSLNRISFQEIFHKEIFENPKLIEKLKSKFSDETLKTERLKFISYRTESNWKWLKERREKEKTFDIKRRFSVIWLSNAKKFSWSNNYSSWGKWILCEE